MEITGVSGIISSILAGGPVIIGTAVILLLMSVLSAAMIAAETLRIVISARDLAAGAGNWTKLRGHDENGRAHLCKRMLAEGDAAMTLLASIAANAPYIGLFGTVVSIYGALTTLGAGTPVTVQQISIPVGEALVMTALGLLVAVPSVLGFNFLLRLRGRYAELVDAFSAHLAGHACPADLRLLAAPRLFNRKA